MTSLWVNFLCPTDQQADRVLPAAGPQREAGERQEEAGQETTVHASGILGTLLPLNPVPPFENIHTLFFNLFQMSNSCLSHCSLLQNVVVLLKKNIDLELYAFKRCI